MTEAPGTAPAAPASRPLIETCPRCGARLAGPYCHACGAEIEGPRLDVRGALAWTRRRLAWIAARLGRTLLDLTIRPADVAWITLGGNRARYLHPVAYVAVALLAEQAAAWALRGLEELRPAAALLIQPGALSRLPHLAVLAALAVIWRVFFRRSGFNVLEMLAVGLYLYGHLVALWTVFALVAGVLPLQGMFLLRWAQALQAGLALVYFSYAGTAIFRENPLVGTFKIAISVAVPLEVLAALDSILRHR